jgi:hypothetical protein
VSDSRLAGTRLSLTEPLLQEWGWKPAFIAPGGGRCFLRINTVMGLTAPWIFARLSEQQDGTWLVALSYRATGGKSHDLETLEEVDLPTMLPKAAAAIDAYEASMRLGWEP